MNTQLIISLILLSPFAFALTAMLSSFQSGFKPKGVKALSMISAILSMILAAVGCFFVYEHGLIESAAIAYKGMGLSIRLDALSIIMFSMISLLSFIVVKFSGNYLDGDQRQGAFMGRLAATIASVQALVLAGNLGLVLLAWIITSISLRRLLVFYHDRPGARIAARKKFLVARLSDISLLIACILIYAHFETGNLEVIFSAFSEGSGSDLPFLALEAPAIFLVLAAALKSAQFPTHGWLIEVMETPTPVSALLHAGLLNAGPFLIIRMATLMHSSSIGPIMLMSIGGLTALFGSVVFMTQTSIKTALGFSSVAHMGFSLMACGLGAYSAAMLHMVAHSFYKAHSFLSSGSVIDTIRSSKTISEHRKPNLLHILLGIIMAVGLYSVFALIWQVDLQKDMALLFIGGIIILGISKIFVSAVRVKGNEKVIARSAFMGLAVLLAFFSLESAMHFALGSQVPELNGLADGRMYLATVFFLLFSLAVLIQLVAPLLSKKPAYQALVIHIRNGFYANALFDRLIGALHYLAPEKPEVIHESVGVQTDIEISEIRDFDQQLVNN